MENKWIGLIAIVAVLLVFVAAVILCCLQKKCRRRCTKNDVESPEEATTEESGAPNVFSISGQENVPFQSIPLKGVIVSPCVSGVSSDQETTIDETPSSLKQRFEEQSLERKGLDTHILNEKILDILSLVDHKLLEQSLEEQRLDQPNLDAQQEESKQNEFENKNGLCVKVADEEIYEIRFPISIERDPEKTIDLHGFTVTEAMSAFKSFLFKMRRVYNENSNQEKDRFIHVITGRGYHSPNGIGKIKRAVRGYLHHWDISHEWINKGGLIIIDVSTMEP